MGLLNIRLFTSHAMQRDCRVQMSNFTYLKNRYVIWTRHSI